MWRSSRADKNYNAKFTIQADAHRVEVRVRRVRQRNVLVQRRREVLRRSAHHKHRHNSKLKHRRGPASARERGGRWAAAVSDRVEKSCVARTRISERNRAAARLQQRAVAAVAGAGSVREDVRHDDHLRRELVVRLAHAGEGHLCESVELISGSTERTLTKNARQPDSGISMVTV